MSHTRHFITAALLAACAAAPAAAQDQVTAYLSRTVEPNSGERIGFHLWGASSVDVEEFRLRTADLESSLRQNGLLVDTSQLTPERTFSFNGWQGDIGIADDPGVYVYVARSVGGGVRVQAQAVVVSRLSIGVKRDDESSLVMINDGARLARNAKLTVYEVQDHQSAPSVLRDLNVRRGVGYYWTRSTKPLIYVARKGRHVAIQNGWDRTWSAVSPLQAHVQTDRPLYRPGQDIHYKAILRERVNGVHRTPTGEDVRVFLRDPQGGRVRIATLQTNDFGSVHGSYHVAAEARLGNYVLEVEAGQATAGGSARVGSVGFGVEEYRKPEFKVDVTTDAQHYVQGDDITATVQADYYFGAPVGRGQVEYTVKKRSRYRWWNPWIRPMVFAAVKPSIWWPGWGSDRVVAQGTATTDARGAATIRFASELDADADADYEITATVVDAANREVSGSANVPVTRAAFDLVLVTDRYAYETGDLVRVRVNLAKADETPVSSAVELQIDALLPDGTEDTRFQRTVSTGSDGTYGITLRASTPNRYRITATATDANGNSVKASQHIWIADDSGARDWSGGGVEIIADKDTYEPGDDALILVRAPAMSGTGLITLEGRELSAAYTFDIVAGLGVITVPIRSTMTPNVFVSVMVPSDEGVKTVSKELQVPPTDKLLNVEVVADKAEYRPGDDATFEVKATDVHGSPVRAEVSLAAVDEALYALREDQAAKLSDTFFPHEWNRVHTMGASGGGWHGGGGGFPGGPIFMATASVAEKAADSADGGKKRSFFPDTLRWIADVETDVSGRATVHQTMADNLTTWRLTARAITRDTEVGMTKTQTLVRKDLVVRLATPRALVEGDELTLVGIVHNLAKPGTAGADPSASVDVQLGVRGLTLLDPARHTVTVPNGGEVSVAWRVRVDDAGKAVLEIGGVAGFDQDALRLELEVAPRGVAVPRAESGSLLSDGAVTLQLDKEAGAIDSASELQISLSPSLAGTLLDSIDYLAGYPYGCIEQTMSKFLPTLMVGETLRLIGRDDPALAAELPKMVKKGVERLQGLQNPDGGFGWFGGAGGASTSHPYVSAYATYGLALAKAQGYEVPQEMLDAAIGYLESSLDDASNTDDSGRAYQVFALSVAGVARNADVNDLASRKDRLDGYAKAVLALAMHNNGSPLAGDMAASLAASAQSSSGRAWWDGNPLRYGSWTSNSVETTAYALWALIEIDPNNGLIQDAMSWLLSRRRSNGQFTTTKDTAAVVMTFARYVQITGELDPDMTVTASVNGQVLGQVRFTQADLGQRAKVLTVPGSALPGGANTVTIQRQGQGALYFTAFLQQYVRMDPIPADDSGIKVEREYFLVTEQLDTNGQIVETETPLSGAVEVGDKVRVKLKVTVSQGADVEHVNLEDRFPSGFEVAEEPSQRYGWHWRWSPWWSAKEVHDDKVVFFATRLPWYHPTAGAGATYEYRYDIKAETAGTFLALPAFAEAVYAPETHGRSAGVEFVVLPN